MSFQPPPFKKLPVLGVCLALAFCLFLRGPHTNFVFDEQEALLANPFLRGDMPLWRAFSLDFWGRPVAETIGSYRPLPNLVWRSLAFTLERNTPLYLQLVNVLMHGLLAALLGRISWRVTRDAEAAWTTSLAFVTLALAVEVVSGVVGLADILAGIAAAALLELALVPGARGLVLVAATTFFGLLAKETLVSVLPLVVLFALVFGPRGAGFRRWVFVLGWALVGVALYVVLRQSCFPFEASFGLPLDAVNNPLLGRGFVERLPTAWAIYAAGASQLVVPIGLSGDYSLAHSVPAGWTVAAVVGAAAWWLAIGFGVLLLWPSKRSEERARSREKLVGFALLWVPLVHLPVSNAFVLLPTIRADRLWYLPALGFCLGLGALVSWALSNSRSRPVALAALGFFLAMQAFAARSHAFDFSNDLTFWRATVRAAPRSAKARLNLGVMLGARGQTEARVSVTREAVALAPDWPMGHVYLGDALCRRERLDEAWLSYRRGFELGSNQRGLVSLALQCLWDKKQYPLRARELGDLAARFPGSWLAYLVRELELSGERNNGIAPAYRPRAYNEKTPGH